MTRQINHRVPIVAVPVREACPIHRIAAYGTRRRVGYHWGVGVDLGRLRGLGCLLLVSRLA